MSGRIGGLRVVGFHARCGTALGGNMIDTDILDLLMGDQWHPDLHPFCLYCGYDLTGSVSNRCPECGRAFSRRELEKAAYKLKAEIRQLDSINEVLQVALVLGIVGMAVVVPTVVLKWTGPWGAVLGKLFGVACGVAAFFTGLTVVRLLKVPPWARRKLKTPVDYGKAYGAVFLGIATVALVIVL